MSQTSATLPGFDAFLSFNAASPEKTQQLEAAASALRQILEVQGFDIGGAGFQKERSKPASAELICRTLSRTLVSADGISCLCGDGADPNTAVALSAGGDETDHLRWTDVLSLAIDDETDGNPGVWQLEPSGKQLNLPRWPSRKLQAAVLEALIAAGADANGGHADDKRTPIATAVCAANTTAVETLLKNGAELQGQELLILRPTVIPSPSSPQYEAALLKIYGRLLQHNPALASEASVVECGPLPMHSLGSLSYAVSEDFQRAYLDLLSSHGADPTAADNRGRTPLAWAVIGRAPVVVDWLCGRVGQNLYKSHADWDSPLGLAGECLSEALKSKPPREGAVEKQKQVIRTLLDHGASIASLPSSTPKARHTRRLVLDIQKEMQRSQPSNALPPPQKQQDGPEGGSSDAATAAKMAAELIKEEEREKAKKAKKGGKKGSNQRQQHRHQQQVSGCEAIEEDDGPSVPSTAPGSSVATGAVNSDAEDQPPSTSSADPHSGGTSSSCDRGPATPAPLPADSESDEDSFPS